MIMTPVAYPFADLALARRLERAEGTSCARFAEASAKAIPGRRAEWVGWSPKGGQWARA